MTTVLINGTRNDDPIPQQLLSSRSISSNKTCVNGLDTDDVEMLETMEQQNKIIECDTKSVSGTGSKKSNDSDSDCVVQNQLSLSEDLQEDLWSVWSDLIKNWEAEYKRRPQYIKQLVRKGIPCHFRTIAWQLLSNANPQSTHDVYAEYMRSPSPHEKVIKRDVSRTYPEHEFFRDEDGRGQQSLLNVMKAYSLHDREVGYCQGSAFIAGLLLLQMPEEEAFAVLTRLMEDYRLRELYKPAMTELGLCMFQLESLVQEQMSDLHMHFQNMGFDTSMYASSWFLTLFTTQLSLDVSYRVMDVFISEGMEMVFRLALAILQLCRVDLLMLDMEGMLRYFQRDVSQRFEQDPELLIATAYNLKYNSKKMKKYEKDYLTKRTKEQEEAVELRRLRTENRLLRQRIEYLEQESGALADRLIQGQVNLAEEAEAKINIKHELFSLREMNADAHRRLEDAYETIRELSSGKSSETVCNAAVQIDDKQMIERIHSLQQELMETKTREADNENTIRNLRSRIHDLETANRRLKETPPDHCVASLQEELISVKMREAEATLSLKEMRQKIAELDSHWQKYTNTHCACNNKNSPNSTAGSNPNSASGSPERRSDSTVKLRNKGDASATADDDSSSPKTSPKAPGTPFSSTTSTPMTNSEKRRSTFGSIISSASGIIANARTGGSNNASGDSAAASSSQQNEDVLREMEELLMGTRIREAEAAVELKEMKQKVMELETQNHVWTNQIRRQDDEYKRLQMELDTALSTIREAEMKLKDSARRLSDSDTQMQEAAMMGRLRETELLQVVAELKSKISELESKNVEKWTQDQINTGAEPETPSSLTNSFTNSADRLSVSSEMDINAVIADMSVKIPADYLSFTTDKPTGLHRPPSATGMTSQANSSQPTSGISSSTGPNRPSTLAATPGGSAQKPVTQNAAAVKAAPIAGNATIQNVIDMTNTINIADNPSVLSGEMSLPDLCNGHAVMSGSGDISLNTSSTVNDSSDEGSEATPRCTDSLVEPGNPHCDQDTGDNSKPSVGSISNAVQPPADTGVSI